MGHWSMCPLDFQLFNFSDHFRITRTLTLDYMWLPIPRKNIQAYSFVTVYCINFIIFLCITLNLSSRSFMPLLAPNPGDATADTQ